MRRWALLVVSFLALSCAHPKQQTVLRNSLPRRALGLSLEVMASSYLGFGTPIQGNRVITAGHMISGTQAYWRGQGQYGHMTLLKDYSKNKDLGLYQVDNKQPLEFALVSEEPPEVGEEVYWPTHTHNGTVGTARGWVVAVEKDSLLLDGWFHPGTSGAGIFRSDGTLVAVGSSGINWSCQLFWTKFEDATLKDQIECLFRKSFFPAGAMAVRVDGWL